MPSQKERPKDTTRSVQNMTMLVSAKNEEVHWVLQQYRRLYTNFRHAEHDLRVAEQNNRARPQHAAVFNKCQFQLEYALGVSMTEVNLRVGSDLKWITPELQQLRNRAWGVFQ